MGKRIPLVLACLAVLPAMGAKFRTTNFIAEAPTPQMAQQFAQAAEHYRKEKALQWLGQEMAPWPVPCPITTHITMGGPGGATTFDFAGGQMPSQSMDIQGPQDKLLASVLPHEVTHTVFAYYFRCPLPRWADEGGAVLSENDEERIQHDKICRNILNHGQAIPLRQLFGLREYPRDGNKVMALYAQGFSVTNFLVNSSSRQTFLHFLTQAMQTQNWDAALRTYYRYNSVEEFEQAWLTHLHNTRQQPVPALAMNPRQAAPAAVAQNTRPAPAADNRIVVRLTLPPAQPDLPDEMPVYRGAAPSAGQEGQRFTQASNVAMTTSRPGYGPGYAADPRRSAAPVLLPPQEVWQPYQGPQVLLGSPQFGQ